jgi:hypothetical protein
MSDYSGQQIVIPLSDGGKRYEANRHFWRKNGISENINELSTNSKNKNIKGPVWRKKLVSH